MARKRYTEEQITAVLNKAEAGAKTGRLRWPRLVGGLYCEVDPGN